MTTTRDIDAVLFDLDGTLLDTAADLAGALNGVLVKHGKDPLPLTVLRNYVSRGAMALVCFGFGCEANSPRSQVLWQELLDYYEANLNVHTTYFDGMERLIEAIEKKGLPWGIVTNKPHFLTMPLITDFGLHLRTNAIVSGDTLPQKKPDPAPLFHACKLLNCDPKKSIYVGDDRRDIQAGNAAGMTTLGATYGYILPSDDPTDWQADALISHPDDVHGWIN